MADGIKEAFSRMKQSQGEESNDASESGGKHESSEGELHSVHHANHGETHSVHRLSKGGKMESSEHKAGSEDTCPLCGNKLD